MWKDPIVAEVRAAREAYAKRFGYDLDKIGADLRKKQAARLAAEKRAKRTKSVKGKSGGAKAKVAKRRKAA